jgi:hypothetical protein
VNEMLSPCGSVGVPQVCIRGVAANVAVWVAARGQTYTVVRLRIM